LIHDSIKVRIEEGFNVKSDGFTTCRGWYSELMGDRCSWNGFKSWKIMEQLINRKATSPTTIRQKPLEPFAITNNLLTPNAKATDLGISPWATTPGAWNNFEKFEDGSFNMNHHERCLLTILDTPLENKWKAMAIVSINKVLSKTKVCLVWYSKIRGGTRP
jgi:hypothetical protein